MKTNNKALMLLLIVILTVSGMVSSVFAAGGDGIIKDPKPTIEITKIRPKESTEYAWEIGGSFGEWLDVGEGNFQTEMDLTAVREIVADVLSVHIEANLSVNASDTLIVELGMKELVPDPDDPEAPLIEEYVAVRRFEGISYTRIAPDSEQIKFDFIWEDIDRSLFDDPETEEKDGIHIFRVIVPYKLSRGKIGEVTVSKEIGLEEHEAYGFVEIQSNFQEVLEAARSEEEPVVTVECPTSKTSWLLDMFELPLGEGDEYMMQTTVTTNDPDALEGDLVQFKAYAYMENNEEFHVWDGVDWPEVALMAVFDLNFPAFGEMYVPSDDATLESLTVLVEPAEDIFVPDQLEYDFTLGVGAEIPTVAAVAADVNATVEITQADMETRTAVVTVTAENGDQLVYHVNFFFEGNDDATLADLTLDEMTIDGFDPTQMSYRKEYPEGEEPEILPEVAGVPTDLNATIVYSETDNSGDGVGYPMTKHVTVTAEDQTTVQVYSVLFCPPGWLPEDEEEEGGNEGGNGKRGSKLQVLAVDHEVLAGFDPEVLSYNVLLAEGTRSLPAVTAVAEDAEATIEHIKPTRLPGQYKVKVNGSDDTESIYIMNMDVAGLAEGEFIELGAAPLPADMLGLWLPPTSDNFVLARTSTQIRFWTSEQLLAPKLLIFRDEEGDALLNGGLEPLVTIRTSELKASGGNGKHSRSTVENGDGGYYKYNLKGRNMPNLEVGEAYVMVLYDGDQIVYFQADQPALLHFVMGDQVKGTVDHRNRTDNLSGRSSNTGTNQ